MFLYLFFPVHADARTQKPTALFQPSSPSGEHHTQDGAVPCKQQRPRITPAFVAAVNFLSDVLTHAAR